VGPPIDKDSFIFKRLSGRLAQLVRVRRSHRRGHWFDSSIAHQSAEHLVVKLIFLNSKIGCFKKDSQSENLIYIYNYIRVREYKKPALFFNIIKEHLNDAGS
jgi:hypothetical protein